MKSKNYRLKFFRWLITKPKSTGFIMFLLLSTIVAFIGFQQYKIARDDQQLVMRNTLHVIHQNIEQTLKNSYTSTLTLALTLNDEGIPENFESISKKLLNSNPPISAIQLVPKGVIKYVYPMKGNEAALGLNILETPYLREEAIRSIQNQKMYFAGPIKLKQGGTGIVGRLPVFQRGEFWGFSAVIIKLEELLKSSVTYVDLSKYYFQFSKVDPTTNKEVYFLPIENNFANNYSVSMVVPDGNWKLELTAKQQNYLSAAIIIPSFLGLFWRDYLVF